MYIYMTNNRMKVKIYVVYSILTIFSQYIEITCIYISSPPFSGELMLFMAIDD